MFNTPKNTVLPGQNKNTHKNKHKKAMNLLRAQHTFRLNADTSRGGSHMKNNKILQRHVRENTYFGILPGQIELENTRQ